jgi:hypothetical protein
MNMQGTPDVKESERMRGGKMSGEERRDAEASLANSDNVDRVV